MKSGNCGHEDAIEDFLSQERRIWAGLPESKVISDVPSNGSGRAGTTARRAPNGFPS
jgi:hypothetical protein